MKTSQGCLETCGTILVIDLVLYFLLQASTLCIIDCEVQHLSQKWSEIGKNRSWFCCVLNKVQMKCLN